MTSLAVVSPWDGSVRGEVPVASCDAALGALDDAARLFRDRDAWLPPWRRIEVLERAAGLLASRAEEFAVRAAGEGGKPLADSRVEVARAVDGLLHCVAVMRTAAGGAVPMGLTKASAGRTAFTRREPIGPVVAISAFNHPLNLIVHQVAPAIAAGCPVVVKPSERTPLSCVAFVDLLREAGLPEAWCRAIVTDDVRTAEALATDPRAAYVSFIGSAAVGWMLRSKLAPGTRCALEHGGAAPVIVAADADVAAAVPLLAKGGYYHAGQVCVSVQRVFAARAVAEELTERLAAAAERLAVGDPLAEATEVGPMIRAREADRVAEWVDEAVAAGGRLAAGGRRLTGSCYAPTVVVDPPQHVRLAREEVFGPVVAVFTYDDSDDAIRRANAIRYAFQAAVFTRDLDLALRCAARLDASAVLVNDHTAFRTDWMPFAGLRASGLGVGGMPHAVRELEIEKLVVLRG